MAVVGTANRHVIIYSLENQPQEYKRHESPLKYQHRCVAIFNDMKKKSPAGYALGSIEGRVAIQYLNPVNPKDNFTFKCHRVNGAANFQDIYAVNDIAFHPIHGTLVTVGSDGTFSFWDKDARTKLKSSELLDQSITKCAFSAGGHIFAYAVGYDWSKVNIQKQQNQSTSVKVFTFPGPRVLQSTEEELHPVALMLRRVSSTQEQLISFKHHCAPTVSKRRKTIEEIKQKR